jgi:lysophospholipase L1-like esterase
VSDRRPLLLWGILVFTTLATIALAGELLVRLTTEGFTPKRHYLPGIFAPDATRGWALAPGYRGVWHSYEGRAPTSTNRLGYRGPEESPERLRAGLRVLVIGDSVAFGRGVADGEDYPARLEALLRERGLDAAVFNLAVPGYDSYLERLTFEQNVERLDPHVLLVGWYRNDIGDNFAAFDFDTLQVIDGYLVYDAEEYQAFRRRTAAGGLQRSWLLNFVRVRWKLWRKALRREERGRRVQVSEAEAFAQTLSQLNALQEQCLARGIRFVLVVHPERSDLDSGTRGLYDALAAGVSQDRFGAASHVVTIADAWRGQPSEPLYQPGDRSHPSARGHASVARLLADLPVWRPHGAQPPRASGR